LQWQPQRSTIGQKPAPDRLRSYCQLLIDPSVSTAREKWGDSLRFACECSTLINHLVVIPAQAGIHLCLTKNSDESPPEASMERGHARPVIAPASPA
jgi:hypothetical protein